MLLEQDTEFAATARSTEYPRNRSAKRVNLWKLTRPRQARGAYHNEVTAGKSHTNFDVIVLMLLLVFAWRVVFHEPGRTEDGPSLDMPTALP